MLNDEVIEAIKLGEFHVYEVSTIEEGIAILTGMQATMLNKDKEYKENTIYRKVTDKLNSFARFTHLSKK